MTDIFFPSFMLAILPLPGSNRFVKGLYGLEGCSFRGIVRIHLTQPTIVKSLVLEVAGFTDTSFMDIYTDSILSRKKTLFSQSSVLLQNIELHLSSYLDIPFDVSLPLHDPITNGFGPCSELLPPSNKISGGEYLRRYNGSTYYIIRATISTPGVFSWVPMIKTTQVKVPFIVYDQRLITGILYPEERRWKSYIGQRPLEYDISINSSVYGPGDDIIFGYKMLVNHNDANYGVRVHRVVLQIKEIHVVGEGRCCSADDARYASWNHSRPIRCRETQDVLYWDHSEERYDDTNIFYSSAISEKYQGLATSHGHIVSDGIYVERQFRIKIPPIGVWQPTTARPNIPSDDHICKRLYTRDAFLQVRHLVRVTIELKRADTIAVEAGIYLSCINKKTCDYLLENDLEVVPTLDYEKLIGIEQWVPEYHKEDDFLTASAIVVNEPPVDFVPVLHKSEDSLVDADSNGIARKQSISSPPPDYQISIEERLYDAINDSLF